MSIYNRSLEMRIAAWWLIVLACLSTRTVAVEPDGAADAWRKIERFFTPPAELAKDLGKYRSPLIFYDGRPVRNAADWQLRRKEILDRWHSLMGPWPPVVEKPKVEVLHSERRENFMQHRVRVCRIHRVNRQPDERCHPHQERRDGDWAGQADARLRLSARQTRFRGLVDRKHQRDGE